ncbi:MAG TPA: STAS domain-containing protein, partial [Solirubrobacteraceae bacterium]
RAIEENGATRLAVAGDLDITAAEPLERAVSAALDGGARELVIDLSPTTFVDSTGLSHLLAARRRADAARARLKIVAPQGSEARVVIDLAGVGTILGVAET